MPCAVRSSYASEPAQHRSRALAPWVFACVLCLACGGSSPRPPILLAVLDTTRVDAVSAYGRAGRTTPYLDALATSGLRYTQAYSQANWTLPSHASLFVGLLPSQHGLVSFTAALDQSFLTLAERLREGGYETAGVNENLIIVATADHGEHFGEQPLIHVPVIVHGLPEVSPAVIDAPVRLLDILPRVLAWVGADRAAGLPGRSLPTRPSDEHEPRIIFSEYVDPADEEASESLRQGIADRRHACEPADKVADDARIALRWPHKLIWYARHANELYDLRADPFEGSNATESSSALAAELEAAPPPRSPRPDRAPDEPRPSPDPALLETLRVLGYLDDPEPHEGATHGADEK